MNKKTILKRLVISAAIAFFIFFIYSVMQARNERAVHTKPQVLTTFTVLADMARSVAGDKANVDSITKPGAEIHGYEPTPQDLVRLQKADLILDNGLNLEKWADKLYQNVKHVSHVTLTDGIAPMPIAEGPYKDEPNPHSWMSPKNALAYVDAIEAALLNVDATNENYYKQNAERYKAEIKKVDEQLRSSLSNLSESNKYLVSCEGAFSYLIRDYGLKELYLWPINADTQGTPQQIKTVVETVRSNAVPAVFCESTVSSKAQLQVASETGSRYGGTFYVDSLSGTDGPTPTYLKLLQYNAGVLIKGLKGE